MKILFITSRYPHPLEKGDKLRAFHFVRQISSVHSVYLISIHDSIPSQKSIDILNVYCEENKVFVYPTWKRVLGLLKNTISRLPYKVSYFYSKQLHKKIEEQISNIKPDIIFCHLIRSAPYVKDVKIPSVLDYMDSFSSITKSELGNSKLLKKLILKKEYTRTLQYEIELKDLFESFTCISENDRIKLPNSSKIDIIRNGVDIDYFHPIQTKKEFDVVFIGNLGYYPNIQAVKYLVKKILPVLKNRKISIRILIAGARPDFSLKQLRSNNVIISGWMDDIRKAYSKGIIFVAPIFFGSGLQNKILEAMAMGLPCITTSKVNSSIKATPGQELLIADNENQFADSIETVLDNHALYSKIQRNALNFVQENFSWDKVGEDIERVIQKTYKEFERKNNE